jgi:hypothetical protein
MDDVRVKQRVARVLRPPNPKYKPVTLQYIEGFVRKVQDSDFVPEEKEDEEEEDIDDEEEKF